MATSLLLDLELVNPDHSPGHSALTTAHLDLYQQLFADLVWAQKLFAHYHIGHWNDEPKHLTPFSFTDNLSELAEGQKILHLLSEPFSESTHLSYEDRHIILSLANKRCTLRVPMWILCWEYIPKRHKIPFDLFAIFQQLVDKFLTITAPQPIFLRRANLRVNGVSFRKFRPEFDYFYLGESTLAETLNIAQYSAKRQAPEYLAQLAQYADFPGIKRAVRGDYLFMQWTTVHIASTDWVDKQIAKALSRRHVWLARSGLIPIQNSFNVLGDKKQMQFTKPLLKPPHIIKASGRKAFILVSTQADITAQDWQVAAQKIQDLAQIKGRSFSKFELVVAKRRLCFEHFALMMNIGATGLSYLDGKHLFTPFPDGMWLNDTHGKLNVSYTLDDEEINKLKFKKSKNYLFQQLQKALICFKKSNNRFLPHWLLRGGMDLTITRIDEADDELVINEGFCMGDSSEFDVRLSDGTVINHGEGTYIEVIKLESV